MNAKKDIDGGEVRKTLSRGQTPFTPEMIDVPPEARVKIVDPPPPTEEGSRLRRELDRTFTRTATGSYDQPQRGNSAGVFLTLGWICFGVVLFWVGIAKNSSAAGFGAAIGTILLGGFPLMIGAILADRYDWPIAETHYDGSAAVKVLNALGAALIFTVKTVFKIVFFVFWIWIAFDVWGNIFGGGKNRRR